jgi:hypothetical protein
MLIKTVWYFQRDRQIEEKKQKTGSPEIDPNTYTLLSFDKGTKAI